MYEVKLGDITFPLAPSEIVISEQDKESELGLLNGKTIISRNRRGVRTYKIRMLLPHKKCVWAKYPDGFKNPIYYLNKLDDMRVNDKPVLLLITRTDDWGTRLFRTDRYMKVSSYTAAESAGNGEDLEVELILKAYQEYESRPVSVLYPNAPQPRKRSVARKPIFRSHTVEKGDTLWLIAHKRLGDGSRYHEVYLWNKELIDKWNKGTGNPTYTIYPKQIFTLKD